MVTGGVKERKQGLMRVARPATIRAEDARVAVLPKLSLVGTPVTSDVLFVFFFAYLSQL